MASGQISLARAYLSAIWLETLFYGMNFVLFWSCICILTLRRRTPKINKPLVLIATLMFCFSTAHVSLGFYRLIEGFIVLADQPGGPSAFFSNVSIPANVVKVGIHTVNSIIGDGVVVWRCYLIWTRNWPICIIPILLVIASAICGFAQTVYFARGKDLHSAFSPELEIWNGALFSLSLVTNVIVTVLIAVRAWYMLRLSGSVTTFRYWRILVLVIESGMIYSVALICEITLYFLNLNAFYIVYDPIGQLTGITPTLILVLAGLELTTNDMHSRWTRSLTKPDFRPGAPHSDSNSSYPGAIFTSHGAPEHVNLRADGTLSTLRTKFTDLIELDEPAARPAEVRRTSIV